ncbi:hypothetical protein FA95DRAFT_1555096 [Auriscalpium vulgare]|uniref:Uncharacterized protein n=1 Tax=Auriscalpium vulgare TaxID=40419 RepID=A0ACB8S4P1_9AGAM|nr:hypothetical protein FA95DRAFT_1555096 [Auriscalpium vulgare]
MTTVDYRFSPPSQRSTPSVASGQDAGPGAPQNSETPHHHGEKARAAASSVKPDAAQDVSHTQAPQHKLAIQIIKRLFAFIIILKIRRADSKAQKEDDA